MTLLNNFWKENFTRLPDSESLSECWNWNIYKSQSVCIQNNQGFYGFHLYAFEKIISYFTVSYELGI